MIEVIVPELQRLPPAETVRAFTVTPRHLGFDEYDIAVQGVISHHYWVDNGEFETFSAPFRCGRSLIRKLLAPYAACGHS